ncbi:hypothetical protein ACJX0J_022490, partial [Zea mays]
FAHHLYRSHPDIYRLNEVFQISCQEFPGTHHMAIQTHFEEDGKSQNFLLMTDTSHT